MNMQANAAFSDAAPRMAAWMHTYTGGVHPRPGALVATGWQASAESSSRQALCVQEVADIEEAIWAPRHGLKGMLDASVCAVVQPASQTQVEPGPHHLRRV